jgi:hypothetical protein
MSATNAFNFVSISTSSLNLHLFALFVNHCQWILYTYDKHAKILLPNMIYQSVCLRCCCGRTFA